MRLVGSEEELCLQIARYLELTHPTLLWHFDYGAGLKMTMGQAVRQKRLNHKSWPDLFIATARDPWHGLFLELKREGTRVFKLDGSVVANEHIFEQWVVLQQLRQLGYLAEFGIGFDDAVERIELYLEGIKRNDEGQYV